MKIAIYVEGITEAGFVYQLIGEEYGWDWTQFRMECLNLDPREAADDLRDVGMEDAPNYFLIYDSCSDTSVISNIRDRYLGHKQNGFDRVVGLRDVYSESYIELYGRNNDQRHISQFIQDIQAPFSILDNTGFIHVRFAVMETEAWLLALSDVFRKIDINLDATGLKNKVDFDVQKDPQIEFFHPFAKLEDIFRSIGRTYSKHWREIKEIVFKLKKADFETLYNSNKCISYKVFHDSLFQ